MKWTFALIALFVIPATAFGAAGNAWMWLQPGGTPALVAPPTANAEVNIVGMTSMTVDMYLMVDQSCAGLGYGLSMDQPGGTAFWSRITGRTHDTWAAAYANKANGLVTGTGVYGTGGYLDPSTVNLGYFDTGIGSDAEGTAPGAGIYKVSTLTLTLDPATQPFVTTGGKINLSIVNPGGGLNVGSYENVFYNNGSLPAGNVHGLILTPEPASMILLALGGLFLRRRHA